jgi:hypothetical protein
MQLTCGISIEKISEERSADDRDNGLSFPVIPSEQESSLEESDIFHPAQGFAPIYPVSITESTHHCYGYPLDMPAPYLDRSTPPPQA